MILRTVFAAISCILISSFCYADEIASGGLAEMNAKKTAVFDVKNSQYKGPTNFKISFPQSWGLSDFARQGLVGRIASANGQGMDSLVIMVSRSAAANGATPDKIFTPEFFAKAKLPAAAMVRAERYKEGNFDGGVMEYLLEQPKPPTKIRTYVTNYLFVQNGALVQLQFYVLLSEKEDKASDEPRIAAFKPLWKAMLATLAISGPTGPTSQP